MQILDYGGQVIAVGDYVKVQYGSIRVIGRIRHIRCVNSDHSIVRVRFYLANSETHYGTSVLNTGTSKMSESDLIQYLLTHGEIPI